MYINSDNRKVSSDIKSVSCKVPNRTIILKPSEVRKYLGSIEKHEMVKKIGKIQTGGTVNVIKIENDDINTNIKWCLIDYNGCYFYTPANYIDLYGFKDQNDNNQKDNSSTEENSSDTYVGNSALDKQKVLSKTKISDLEDKPAGVSVLDLIKPGGTDTDSDDSEGDNAEEEEPEWEPDLSNYECLERYDSYNTYAVTYLTWYFKDYMLTAYAYPDHRSEKIDPGRLMRNTFSVVDEARKNIFPVDGLWINHETGWKFYSTSYFAESLEDIWYIPEDFVHSILPAGGGVTRMPVTKEHVEYRMCWDEYAPLYTITGLEVERYVQGDIFCSTYRSNKNKWAYTHWTHPNGNVFGVCPKSYSMTPPSPSPDVFNMQYMGIISGGKLIEKRIPYDKIFEKPDLFNYDNLDYWYKDDSIPWSETEDYTQHETKTPTESTHDIIDKIAHRTIDWNDLFSKNSVNVFNMRIVVNWFMVDGTPCLLGFENGNNPDWYIIKDVGDIAWSPMIFTYDSSETKPGEEYDPNYSDWGNREYAFDDVGENDIYAKKETGIDNVGGHPSTVSTNSTKDPTKDTWEITLDPGNEEWDVPFVYSKDDRVEPDYDGWVHIQNALDYELRDIKGKDWMDDRHVRKINRFKLQNNNSGLSTKSFIFVTRPDLNLYRENYKDDNPYHDVVDPWTMNPDLIRLPTFKYIARLKNACRTIMPSLEYWGTNSIDSPWLAIMTNQATGYAPTDREMDMVEVGETFHGSKVIYAEPTFKHKIGGTVSIPFVERRDLTLYYTLKMWIDYIQAVSIGRCEPRRIHKYNQELDYAVSLYYISTDETMENILYWEKLTGLIPLTVPDSFFEWEEGNPARRMQYTINFAYSFRTVQDEMHLMEINNLYNKWRTGEETGTPSDYYDYDYVYDESFNKIMAKISSSYGLINEESENDINNYAMSKELMQQYYYGNMIRNDGYTNDSHPHGYVHYAGVNNSNEIISPFLPNYVPQIGMHGVPYVKGPFITREPDRYKDDKGEFGTPVDNGIYKLRWV